MSFLELDDLEIARQMTNRLWADFCRLQPLEFFHSAWSKPHLQHQAPNLLSLVKQFNQISSQTATLVLRERKLRGRARMVEKMIQIAKHLRELKNFHALMAMISGLNNAALTRLRWTRAKLPTKVVKIFSELEAEMSMLDSFKVYRALIDNIASHSVNVPVLPYLGVYLSDLTFIEDGNLDNYGPRINFSKRQLVASVVQKIQRFQAVKYNFYVSETFQRYLHDLPCFDDEQLYSMSLQVEPRNCTRGDVA